MELKSLKLNLDNDKLSNEKKIWNQSVLFLLVAVAILFLFYGLGNFRTLGSHEGYAAVPAQEMLDSGNWIVPQFGHKPRLQKPPLSYWVIAFTSRFTVGEVTEWTARFPSALAALLLAVVMGYWAGKWYGVKSGIAAVVIQVTSVYVMTYGRKAEIDMILCLLTTSVLFLIASENRLESRQKNFFRWTGIFILLSLSWLGKFHYGLAMVLVPVAIYFITEKKYRHFIKFLHPVGLPILLTAIFLWPYLVLQAVPDAREIWMEETVGRASGLLGHDPVWFYIPRIMMCTLPWFPFSVFGIPESLRKAIRSKSPQERFIWIWLISDLAIITLQPMKHIHYLLAVLPAMTLLSCQPLAQFYAYVKQKKPEINSTFFKCWNFSLVVLALAGIYMLSQMEMYFSKPFEGLVLFVLLFSLIVNTCYYKKQFRIAFASLIILLGGTYVITNDQLVPLFDSRLQVAKFAREIGEDVPAKQKIWFYKTGMDPILFYVDRPVYRATSVEKIESVLYQTNNIFVLAREEKIKELAGSGRITVLKKMEVDSHSIQPKRNDFVLVKLNKISELVSQKN